MPGSAAVINCFENAVDSLVGPGFRSDGQAGGQNPVSVSRSGPGGLKPAATNELRKYMIIQCRSFHVYRVRHGHRKSTDCVDFIGKSSAAPAALISAWTSDPGLTAGPGHFRPFGPFPGARFGIRQGASAEGATGARPGRQAGIRGSWKDERRRRGRNPDLAPILIRPAGPTVARPGRQAGMRMGAERAPQARHKNQASGFAGGH
jgi:hypothetical protein